MGMIGNDKIVLCGNFVKVQKKRPKDWAERDSKWIEPYNLKWRAKIGKVECDCKEIEYTFQPYYGFTLYHMSDCALGKHLKKYPGIYNLIDPSYPMLAQSD